MGKYGDRAKALFSQGYSCSQAVLLAFADELNLDAEVAARISSSFGGGMGRLREVCGAVSGMFMVAGLHMGCSDPKDAEAKALHYSLIQSLAGRFKEKNGSIVCRELLGLSKGPDTPTPEQRTETYYKKRPCAEYVGDAADMIGEFFTEEAEQKQQ